MNSVAVTTETLISLCRYHVVVSIKSMELIITRHKNIQVPVIGSKTFFRIIIKRKTHTGAESDFSFEKCDGKVVEWGLVIISLNLKVSSIMIGS